MIIAIHIYIYTYIHTYIHTYIYIYTPIKEHCRTQSYHINLYIYIYNSYMYTQHMHTHMCNLKIQYAHPVPNPMTFQRELSIVISPQPCHILPHQGPDSALEDFPWFHSFKWPFWVGIGMGNTWKCLSHMLHVCYVYLFLGDYIQAHADLWNPAPWAMAWGIWKFVSHEVKLVILWSPHCTALICHQDEDLEFRPSQHRSSVP